MHPVDQFHLMEINDKTERNVEQLHVTQKLGFMDGQDFLNCLQFEQQTTFDEHVKSQGLLEHEAFIFDPDDTLVDGSHISQAQLAHQTLLVNTFDESGPFQSVDFNGG